MDNKRWFASYLYGTSHGMLGNLKNSKPEVMEFEVFKFWVNESVLNLRRFEGQ